MGLTKYPSAFFNEIMNLELRHKIWRETEKKNKWESVKEIENGRSYERDWKKSSIQKYSTKAFTALRV